MQSLVKASFFQTFVNRLIRLVPELLILVKALLLLSQIALANFSDVLPPWQTFLMFFLLLCWKAIASAGRRVMKKQGVLHLCCGLLWCHRFFHRIVCYALFCSNCRCCSSCFHILKFKAIRRHSPFQAVQTYECSTFTISTISMQSSNRRKVGGFYAAAAGHLSKPRHCELFFCRESKVT